MQNDNGLRRLLTLPRIYNAYQTAVGATCGRGWVSRQFWHLAPGQKVVDIGCGPGSAIRYLPADVQYVGFDISEHYIAYARERFAGDRKKTFLVGTAEQFIADLPSAMHDADLVIVNGLLHHLDDDAALAALRLASKALSARGRLVALQGTFLIKQARISHWFVNQDRGRNVRSEPAWKALVGRVFDDFETYILTGLDRPLHVHRHRGIRSAA